MQVAAPGRLIERPPTDGNGSLEAAALVAASVVAALVVAWATSARGIALTNDGVAYLAVAESLRAGNGLTYWLQPIVASWPPGYPVLVAATGVLSGLSTAAAARLVGIMAVAALVPATWLLARPLLDRPWLRVAVALAVGIAPTTILTTGTALSDATFAVACTLALAALVRAVVDDRPALLATVAATVAGATMLRYAGVWLLPVVGVALWLAPVAVEPRRRRRRAVATAVAAATPVVLWLARNVLLGEPMMGERVAAVTSVRLGLTQMAATLGRYAVADRDVPLLVGATLAVALLAALGVGLALPRSGSEDRPETGLAVVVGFITATLVGLAGSVATTDLAGTDPRLLLPVLPAVLVALGAVGERLARRGAAPLVATVAVVWTLVLLVGSVAVVDELRTEGRGETSRTSLAVLADPALAAIPTDCTLWSNRPWLLSQAGFRPALTPHADGHDTASFLAAAADGGCLVWVETDAPGSLAALAEIQRLVELAPVVQGDLLDVYRIVPITGDDADQG